MSVSAYDLSAGVFLRGLTNLKAQVVKAEAHAAAGGVAETALLNASLAAEGPGRGSPADLHGYTFAAQVHWAAEGARLAMARLLGEARAPLPSSATRFSDLHRLL